MPQRKIQVPRVGIYSALRADLIRFVSKRSSPESHVHEADLEECIFERDPEGDLGFLLSQYLSIFIYQVLLNAKASEQSARMVSMKNATDSAEELIRDLTLEYNKLRQGNITKELLEIAGGQAD